MTLRVENLHKKYRDILVLQGVNFELSPGQITGFVGRNGAGKTTTMRSIMKLIEFDHGSVTLGGEEISRRNLSKFGYMPEERGLYQKEKIISQLKFFSRLQSGNAESDSLIFPLLEEFELFDRSEDFLGKLSLGNQQRIQFMVSILHDPEVLILDEPFNGLDPVAQNLLMNKIKKLVESGKSVLFSSHSLELIEQISNRILILNNGKIVADDSLEELRRRPYVKYSIDFNQLPLDWNIDKQNIRTVLVTESRVTVEFADNLTEFILPRLIAKFSENGNLRALTQILPSLREIYEEMILP